MNKFFIFIIIGIIFLCTGCTSDNKQPKTHVKETSTVQTTTLKANPTVPKNDDTVKSEPSSVSQNVYEILPGKKPHLSFDFLTKLMYMTRKEAIEKLGANYKIVPAGGEGTYKGYWYEELDIGLVFDTDDESSALSWIKCGKSINVKGAHNGMTFKEVMGILGNTEIRDTFVETPDHKAYMLQYIVDNCGITYFSQSKDGRPGSFSIFRVPGKKN